MTLHGYYIASCIEIMMIIVKLVDNEKKYNKKYGTEQIVQKMISRIKWINKYLFITKYRISPTTLYKREEYLKYFINALN